jgi:CRISPR system Cascade subunit CasD
VPEDPAAPPPRTVLLRLAAPLQSWGTHSLFERRDTAAHPTASGVIGLVRCALGHTRDTPLGALADAQVAVRVDQPGTILRDYQTVGIDGYRSANGKITRGEPKLSVRFYLQDAVFVAALTHPDPGLLAAIDQALARPHWPLYLGRKSCPPAQPVRLGLSTLPPADALAALPYQGHRHRPPATLTVLTTGTDGQGESVQDIPRDYARREYGARALAAHTVAAAAAADQPAAAAGTADEPDPA